MILAILFLFVLIFPIQRFLKSDFDKRVRWQLLGIRWGVSFLALMLMVALSVWDQTRAGGKTPVVAGYVLLGACYALGEWLARRRLESAGIPIRETVRGVNY